MNYTLSIGEENLRLLREAAKKRSVSMASIIKSAIFKELNMDEKL